MSALRRLRGAGPGRSSGRKSKQEEKKGKRKEKKRRRKKEKEKKNPMVLTMALVTAAKSISYFASHPSLPHCKLLSGSSFRLLLPAAAFPMRGISSYSIVTISPFSRGVFVSGNWPYPILHGSYFIPCSLLLLYYSLSSLTCFTSQELHNFIERALVIKPFLNLLLSSRV